MHLTLNEIDVTNEAHVDYVLEHLESYNTSDRAAIYNMLDLEIKQTAWDTYCSYNIRDVELVDMLDDKLKLMELVYAMAFDAKVNFQDTFTTVRAWDVIIHNYLMERNIVVPQIKVPEFNRGILGGYVKDVQTGMHKWVMSFDLASLYPHIIMQYNISPETFAGWFRGAHECETKDLAEARALMILNKQLDDEGDSRNELVKDDITLTGNWTTFRRDRLGFLPSLMKKYYNERVIYKGKMIDAKKEIELIDQELRRRENAKIK